MEKARRVMEQTFAPLWHGAATLPLTLNGKAKNWESGVIMTLNDLESLAGNPFGFVMNKSFLIVLHVLGAGGGILSRLCTFLRA
jgi:hypothetical protein